MKIGYAKKAIVRIQTEEECDEIISLSEREIEIRLKSLLSIRRRLLVTHCVRISPRFRAILLVTLATLAAFYLCSYTETLLLAGAVGLILCFLLPRSLEIQFFSWLSGHHVYDQLRLNILIEMLLKGKTESWPLISHWIDSEIAYITEISHQLRKRQHFKA